MIDRATESRVRSDLERAVCTLLSSRDGLFYAHVLVRMGRRITEEVETIAVTIRDGRVVLLVNPSFWQSLAGRPDLREGVLIHEVLHVVLRHIERSLAVPDRDLFNIAADLAVNEIVGGHRLPEGAFLVEEMPEHLGIERGATAEGHYERLALARREGQSLPQSDCMQAAGMRGSHSPWPLDPCGHLAVGGGIAAAASGGPAAVRASINELVDAAARQTAMSQGAIPAAVARAIDAARPRRFPTDWRSVLRIFGASGVATHLKPTIMSESKRFGTVPGVRVRQKQALAVVVDTSGSIGDEALGAFFTEIHALWRLGVEVTVIECDAEIPEGGVWKYTGRPRSRAGGGGGTDFDPAIRFVNTRPFDGVIYLTDGHGTRSIPCRWRMLWMLTTDPASFEPDDRPWRPREAFCRLEAAAVRS